MTRVTRLQPRLAAGGNLSELANKATSRQNLGAVNAAGDTLTGPLVLAADPTTALGAATRRYVDGAVTTAFGPLKRALADGSRSCAILLLGDSTGNDTDEWAYLFAQSLAASYPAWTVQYKLWNDTTQAYNATATVQTGTAGVRALDRATGAGSRRMSAATSPSIASGTIDVRVNMLMPDWTPASQPVICGRSGVAGSRGWYFYIDTTGYLGLLYSTDGTATATMGATAPTGIADGTASWVRWVFTPDDGAGNRVASFYKSVDGVTWTQLGTTVTTAGAVAVNQPASVGYEIGNQGALSVRIGQVYEVQIRDGVDGLSVVPRMPDLWPPYDSTAAYFTGAPVLTILNASVAGAGITYLGDATRLPKMASPDYGQTLVLLSTSHNEGGYVWREWMSRLDTWRTAVKAQVPNTPVVHLTQNPEKSAATDYREHGRRRIDTIEYARANRYPFIDTYQAFLDYGDWAATLMLDNVHPNSTGSAVWRDCVRASFDAAA